MFKKLVLARPLAVIDLETTGVDPRTDRIVEISVLKVVPGEEPVHKTRRVNPGIPIPPEATQLHRITDADVAGEPPFAKLAAGLLKLLEGCDLCGFNIKRFDLPLLTAEFERAGTSFSLAGRAIIDPLEIFHRREPRDLAAAVRFYCGREHIDAHSAAADVLAAVAVLDGILERYDDLPRTLLELHEQFRARGAADAHAKFLELNGQLVFNFGKFQGKSLDEIATNEPTYLQWMLSETTFLADTKEIVRAALARGKG
jgi:DNA polymerase-3 subunit epsilon